MAKQYTTKQAPPGGYEQGGWYWDPDAGQARQYWNGSFGAPTTINNPNQVGYGQRVSDEVQKQSGFVAPNPTKTSTYNPTTGYTTGAGTGASGSGAGFTPPPTLDLTKIYDESYAASGIKELEEQLAQREREYTEARGKNNDNPFLSEATRVGREAKLERLKAERTTNLQNEIAMKKADVETKLNLNLKQFDINSQAAQQALQQFNTLLSLGALDNATGEDIANITRSTGISSDMIQSAIKKANQKDVKTQVITSTNDAGIVTASVINTETGEVIAQNNLGKIGNAQTGNTPKASDAEVKRYYLDNLRTDISNYKGVKDIFNLYAGYIDPNEILNIYNSTSPYGPAKESQEELAAYGVKF